MGFGIVIPLLPIYAKQMNATPFTAGALIAVYSQIGRASCRERVFITV